jgi:hypothetical protein
MSSHKRGISFAEQVASDSQSTLSYPVSEDSTVESVKVRIYPGPGTDLEIEPYVYRGADGDTEPLVRYEGKQYVDGDDDVWEWDISVPVTSEDEIRVRATNQDTQGNDYDYRVNMDVSNVGGTAHSLISALKGVF